MAIHHRTCTPLWWAVGSCNEELQITPMPSRWKCETDFWGANDSTHTNWGLPNSRPLVALPPDDDGIEALMPGHFLIGRPIEALPDPAIAYRSISVLSRWHLCQALIHHLWKRWSADYLDSFRCTYKWHSLDWQGNEYAHIRLDNDLFTCGPLASAAVVQHNLPQLCWR